MKIYVICTIEFTEISCEFLGGIELLQKYRRNGRRLLDWKIRLG